MPCLRESTWITPCTEPLGRPPSDSRGEKGRRRSAKRRRVGSGSPSRPGSPESGCCVRRRRWQRGPAQAGPRAPQLPRPAPRPWPWAGAQKEPPNGTRGTQDRPQAQKALKELRSESGSGTAVSAGGGSGSGLRVQLAVDASAPCPSCHRHQPGPAVSPGPASHVRAHNHPNYSQSALTDPLSALNRAPLPAPFTAPGTAPAPPPLPARPAPGTAHARTTAPGGPARPAAPSPPPAGTERLAVSALPGCRRRRSGPARARAGTWTPTPALRRLPRR